jgi:manganese/zinc/iron transport system substrate-binding protein
MNRKYSRAAIWAVLTTLSALLLLAVTGCSTPAKPDEGPSRIYVVATTSIIADTAKEIGGEVVRVDGLMGPGIDPHLYKATEGDAERLNEADLILYNGLHLEAGMTEVFERMQKSGKEVVAVTDGIPEEKLIPVEGFEGNFDPHVWMDVSLWMDVSKNIANAIIEQAPDKEEAIKMNLEIFLGKLRMLDQNIRIAVGQIPEEQRVLVTAHDAFGYFGKQYGVEVRGLQGVSTASEAGARDVQELATFIAERKIPAIFVESSVPYRNIEALQEAVKANGHEVRIGRPLYSDSIGDYGTAQASYVGMMRFNAGIIGEELTPPDKE